MPHCIFVPPGAGHPPGLASSHKLGRPFGLAVRWPRTGLAFVSILHMLVSRPLDFARDQ